MIDFHTHILPNIDDGSKSIEETFNLIKEAEKAGFKKIISTSHYLEKYYEVDVIERKAWIDTLNKTIKERNEKIKLYLGNEIYFSDNIIKLLEEGKATTINNTSYLLFELPLNAKPFNIYNIIYELLEYKLIPVLAHPERYTFVQSEPELVYDLIQKGVLMQCNYGSIIGQYGKKAQIIVKKLYENNMVHFLGTDVHKQNTIYERIPEILPQISEIIGEEKLEVSLFDKIRLKTINVNVIEDVDVIPVGEIVGIKLYTNGVMVVGMASIEGEDGNIYKPYQDTGIQEGDCITYVNGTEIASTEDLTEEINKSLGNEIELTFNHKEETRTGKIKSVKNKDGKYKLGLWVRDSAAGVGTVTFYNEDTKCFSALGHAITDIDTGEVLTTSSGEIDTARILSIVKGQKDEPGRVEGAINSKTLIGSIYNNTKFGIFGVIKNTENIQLDFNKKMKVASRNEIKLGEATCLSSIDGEIKEYKLEITKIYQNNNYDNKSMLINITDENLLEKTGGIIQGMSGTPIIQNGKFVGAITHVLVNNPTVGYAVFGDLMLKY